MTAKLHNFLRTEEELELKFVSNHGQLAVNFVSNHGQLALIFVSNHGQHTSDFVPNHGQHGANEGRKKEWERSEIMETGQKERRGNAKRERKYAAISFIFSNFAAVLKIGK